MNSCSQCPNPATGFIQQNSTKVMLCEAHASSLHPNLKLHSLDELRSIDPEKQEQLNRRTEAEVGYEFINQLLSLATAEAAATVVKLDASNAKAVSILTAAYLDAKRKVYSQLQQVELGLRQFREELDRYSHSKETQLSEYGRLLIARDKSCVPRLIRSVVTDNSYLILQAVRRSCKTSTSSPQVLVLAFLGKEEREVMRKEMLNRAETVLRLGDRQLLEEFETDLVEMDLLDVDRPTLEALKLKSNQKLRTIAASQDQEIDFLLLSAQSPPAIRKLADDLRQLGEAETQSRRHYQACELFLKSAQLLSGCCPFEINTAQAYIRHGALSRQTHVDRTVAESSLQKAVEILSQCAPVSKEICNAYYELSLVYIDNDDYQRAELALTKALQVQSVHFPTESETAESYLKLGSLYSAMVRYSEAEQAYRAALKIQMAYFPTSNSTAASFFSLGCVHTSRDLISAAETYMIKSIQLWSSNGQRGRASLATAMVRSYYKTTKKVES